MGCLASLRKFFSPAVKLAYHGSHHERKLIFPTSASINTIIPSTSGLILYLGKMVYLMFSTAFGCGKFRRWSLDKGIRSLGVVVGGGGGVGGSV